MMNGEATSNKYAIFDLDGCISDDRHRRHLLPDYDAYHALCDADEPCNHAVVEAFAEESGICRLFVTGRTETCRSKTVSWIRRHFGVGGLNDAAHPEFLLMRPADDHTPAPELKVRLLERNGFRPEMIVVAYDDRDDVLEAYRQWGIENVHKLEIPAAAAAVTAADLLAECADTFRERNMVYKDNYRLVAPVVRALFPNGVPRHLPVDDVWHLVELIIVKLTRFAASEFTHTDSIHDIAVYAAMIEADLLNRSASNDNAESDTD